MDTANSFQISHVFTGIGNRPAKALGCAPTRPHKAYRLGEGLAAGLAVITVLVDFKPKAIVPQRLIADRGNAFTSPR